MKKDDAVSEVVGVLLMLTITIILASIVALVATGTVGETEKPLVAEVTATGVINENVVFELLSGDSFQLSDIKVSLGIREDSTKSATVLGSSLKPEGSLITLGDRFRLTGTSTTDGISFGGMNVKKGEHLTYRFYDKSGKPFSSGEIRVP